jgi:ATP-dependent 26S proteasome regulatory subunit
VYAQACIIFFDEIDAIGGSRGGGEDGGSDNEVQRTMLQIVTELDGFDPRGNIKVMNAILATAIATLSHTCLHGNACSLQQCCVHQQQHVSIVEQ